MKPTVDQSQEQSVVSTDRPDQAFNFEQWARQVRPQLIASLQKRGAR
ncbi:MAG TPA: hypothetical protein V6D18_10110 [Thermosynechococcaceae cyanobacterium]|jgi:hypothetical protein